MVTSDNEWQLMVQRVTTNDNEWQRVTTNDKEWQRVTRNDNEWHNERQRVTISVNFSFFQIREEPTTKHPKENSLNLEEDLWLFNWIKSRTKYPRRNTNSKKQELQKQLFADFDQNKIFQYSQENTVLESLLNKVAGLEARKSVKRRLQHWCFPVNIVKFLRTAFSIEQLWWLLLKLRYFFSLWYITWKFMTK